MTTNDKLQKLFFILQRLVAILRLDERCPWTAKFEADLLMCASLIDRGSSDADLAHLSNSITHVFQGMGSFNDYSPFVYEKITGQYLPIPGTEDFENVTKEVFDLALMLRVHGGQE